MNLITWNIQACTGCDGVVSPRRIVEDARRLADFDVLCLQEVAANFAGFKASRGEDQFAELAALLPGYTLVPGIAVDVLGSDNRRQRFGNAIFSRLPVLQVIVTRLPRPSDPSARRSMERCLLEAVVETAIGPLRVMTTHIEFFSKLEREAQVEAILHRHAEACLRSLQRETPHIAGCLRSWPEPEDTILAGDFNFDDTDPLYRRLTADRNDGVAPLADVWKHVRGGGPCPPTVGLHDTVQWPRAFACDFALATPRLLRRVRRVEVDARTMASDHQPMLVELATA